MTARKSQARAGVLFASPWIIGFFGFIAYPVLASFYYSFCEYSVLKPPILVGVSNYVDLFHDSVFWQSLYNTFFFAILSVPACTFMAISLALLLNAKVRGQAFYRTFFYLPALVPQAALAMLWLWMFKAQHGILNMGLAAIHIKGPDWMSKPEWTKPAMILMTVWTVGNAMIIYLASLQEVPVEQLEASDLDGAGPVTKFRNVILPMISPVVLFNVIMAIINSMQVFTIPYIMFPGGEPAKATYFYTMYLFDNAMIYHKMGYACAMGWIMFLIIFGLTLTAIKVSNKKVYYAGG